MLWRLKIVSGGQTGADRAALDAALSLGVECGGWCPEDRAAEDGAIDPRYPLEPLAGAGYRRRTTQNVIDSDATAIFFFGAPDGGTAATLDDCRRLAKPHLVIDASSLGAAAAAEAICDFVDQNGISTLNVAGPRASKQPAIYDYVHAVIGQVLRRSADGA
jgi:hypothetical protein